MKGKTAVIAVSTGCLDYLDIQADNLFMIRCKILMEGNTYNDFVEINADTFYEKIKTDKDIVPTSSMPSLGEILETFELIEKQGYERVLVITISSALSGTYQTCEMAKKSYEGDLTIDVIDSKNAAISEGFIVLKALEMIEQNQNVDTIIKTIEHLSVRRKQYFMVDSLRLLVKNGRLSGASGFLGSLLRIKPILQVNNDGKIVPFEKIRTQKKALDRMVELILEDLATIDDFVITYNTSDNLEGFNYVKQKIDAVYPTAKTYAAPITPVIGCHTGHGTVGIAYFNLDSIKET